MKKNVPKRLCPASYMVSRHLEISLLNQPRREFIDYARRLMEFSKRFAQPEPDVGIQIIPSVPTRKEVDPILNQWAQLSALALLKMYKASQSYHDHRRYYSLDGPAAKDRAGKTVEANRTISENQFSETDYLALKALKELSELPSPPTSWQERTLGPYHQQVHVTAERQAQINAFGEIMSDMRKSGAIRTIFENLDEIRERTASQYSR